MPVEYRVGDLFEQGFQAIGHGVNCRGAMGAGIALEFSRRWPNMHVKYRDLCVSGALKPGGVYIYGNKPVVYNLATQYWPGANAKLEYLNSSLRIALADAEEHGIGEIGVPRIGAGIGGLTWEKVRVIMEAAAGDSPVTLIVMSLAE